MPGQQTARKAAEWGAVVCPVSAPKPYYHQDGITIYHGDCRRILPDIEGAIDLILTDPPYGIGYENSWRQRGDNLRKRIDNDNCLSVVEEVWPMCIEKLSEDRHWYTFASPRKIQEVVAITGEAKHILCWDKGDTGTVGDLACGFGESWEAILYGMKGRRKLRGKRPRTVVRVDWFATKDPVHPTVKPVPLLQKLIAWSTDEAEVVLDPFCGSGTTLMAAKLTGRRAIGIETEERYCEIAARRLDQGVLF